MLGSRVDAVSQLNPGDFDWKIIFASPNGAQWFHTGGIFAALSGSTAQVAAEAIDAARQHGTPVSYDLNYRESLWKSIGGKTKAQEVNRNLVGKVDVLLGNEEDFSAMLGVKLKGVAEILPSCRLLRMSRCCVRWLRSIRTEAGGEHAAHGVERKPQRVGRDCVVRRQDCARGAARNRHSGPRGRRRQFRIGVDLRMLAGKPIDWGCGAAWRMAHGHDDPGDTSMATLAEVERLMKGDSARISR